MFTGIISKTAKVKKITAKSGGLVIEIPNTLGKVKLGESITINGVCSTVKKSGVSLSFEYMPESLKLSNLSFVKKGDTVNLERSMKFGDRLDGHIVLGHIDGKGKILNIVKEGNSSIFEVEVPDKKFRKLLVYKGSVTVEGISLTVAKVSKKSFTIKVIPYTMSHTNLKEKKVKGYLNLEFDILAKYANAAKK